MFKMQLINIAVLAAATGSTLTSAFQYNIYSDTGCQNLQQIWNGEGTNPFGDPAQSLDINGYVGSISVVSEDEYTSQLDLYTSTYDHTCLYYSLACCAGAPDCAYNYAADCMVVDETVQALSSFYTTCDTVCIDTIYKKN